MTIRQRVNKLEKATGTNQTYKYLCVTGSLANSMDTPEEKAKGYKIQPYTKRAGGTVEKPFYLPSWVDVEEFSARPDVDLTVIQIGYTDN